MEYYTEAIPTWALCYLYYGDTEGLTEEEITMIEAWRERNNVSDVCVVKDEEGEIAAPYFKHHPIFGLSTDVIDCHVILR